MADVGRPTSYDPEFCERVLAWGAEGKSKAWMAANLGVARQTLENWSGEFPAFLDALTRSRDLAQAWWEDLGQSNMVNMPGQGTLNAGAYNKSMSARFPEDWREKTETALTGAGGGPVQIIASDHDEKL